MQVYQLCTYFDVQYFLKGRAMFHSLEQHVDSFVLWVLCLDDTTYELLVTMNDRRIIPVRLADLEAWEPRLPASSSDRSLVEYYWTCTPTWLAYILSQQDPGAWVSYLDADLYFYDRIDDIFNEAGNASVVIHAHRFGPQNESKATVSGIYNVGLTSFRNDELGWQALRWWQSACFEACYLRPDEGYCGDQKYLDDWPVRFEGVHVLQNLGAGLAPWNVNNYQFKLLKEILMVDGRPLIFYHFHAFQLLSPRLMGQRGYDVPEAVYRYVYRSYARALQESLEETRRHQPEFRAGFSRPPWRELVHDLRHRRYFWI
jgi:hypothetical protein